MARNNMTYSFGNNPVTGSAISTFVNENLSWEKRKTMNVGLDLALFNNRIEFTAEWYKNKSQDLHYGVPVPASAGVSNASVTMNAASMENSGFEFSLTYRNRDHALKHEISANLSTLKNKVTSLGFGTEKFITGSYITEVGQEVGKFYGWDYQGIIRTQEQLDELNESARVIHNRIEQAKQDANPNYEPQFVDPGKWSYQPGAQVGDCWYSDLNNDGQITEADRSFIGDPNPDIYGNIFTTLMYKRFKLDVNFNYSLGNDVYNYMRSQLEGGNRFMNQTTAVTRAWQTEGQVTDIPRVTFQDPLGNSRFSDRWIEDGSYLRLKSVTLSYSLPIRSTFLQGLQFWVQGNNLLTFTKYLGSDPEFSMTSNVLGQGIDLGQLPQSRSIVAGIKINL
jgi:hypothetical protein